MSKARCSFCSSPLSKEDEAVPCGQNLKDWLCAECMSKDPWKGGNKAVNRGKFWSG